jgi:hypothetical protein
MERPLRLGRADGELAYLFRGCCLRLLDEESFSV